ncbi:unnamed protein product [Cylindrotheca closterium]|uniref:Uncharacterized protein n=1 Tax=Cylindrotheca closterium TaxID=2856 RepID=A0AAD2FGB0_9STRA|nr:unnamed protein product [Cylindrotheca closterium]
MDGGSSSSEGSSIMSDNNKMQFCQLVAGTPGLVMGAILDETTKVAAEQETNQLLETQQEICNIFDETKSALNHFNDFLCIDWGRLRPGEPVPLEKDLHQYVQLEELTVELFGRYATYLVECNNKTEEKRGNVVPISLNSAIGYFSAVKVAYLEQPVIRNATTLPSVFWRETWSNLNCRMTNRVVERHKTTGTPLVSPKAAATTDDWKALACVCVWNGSQKLLEFWAVFVALVHMAAQVNEVAFLQFPDAKTTLVNGGGNTKNRVGLFSKCEQLQARKWSRDAHISPH